MLPIVLMIQGAGFVASIFHKKPAAAEPLFTETPNNPSSSDTATFSASGSGTSAPTMLAAAEGGLDVATSALSEFPVPLSPTAGSLAGAYTLARALYPNRPPDVGNYLGLPHVMDISGSLTDQSSGGYD